MAPVCSLALPRSHRRRRPGAEQLELRALLSTLPNALDVVQTDPAAGSTVRQSPTTITVTFNAAVDPFSLSPADFGLDQINADGSLTPLDPTGMLGLLTEVGVSDSNPDAIALTVNQPLAPGHYEIVLLGGAMLDGFDANGNTVFWTAPGGFGTDTSIADFTVATPGVTLNDATDLGSVGAAPVITAGALDLGTDPSAVALYRVTLDPGHAWQFGAELWTSRINSPLHPTLSLFDAQGQLVKTVTIGSFALPYDPHLFEILQPGTYYIGVSGAGNVPGQPGGYDPVAGTPGASTTADGGTFLLALAAVTDGSPAQVESFQVQQADPTSAVPTGFAIGFSSPIDVQSLSSDGGQTIDGVELVDQDGLVWPVIPVAADAGDTRLTFVFNQQLPPGHYSLRVPARGGIADLFGRAPVAAGQPAGTLATFAVGADTTPRAADDLGIIFPSAVRSGFGVSAVLQPGQSVTYRFVMLPLPNPQCVLTGVYSGGLLRLQVTGPNGTHVTTSGTADGQLNAFATLTAGVYHITLTNAGTDLLVLSSLQYIGAWTAQLPANGLGQSAALNLLFVGSPTAPATGAGSLGSTLPTTVTTAIVTTVASPGATPLTISSGPSAPSAPGGLVLTLGGSLVGIVAPSYPSHSTESIDSDAAALAQVAVPPAQPLAPRSGETPLSTADGTDRDAAIDEIPPEPASTLAAEPPRRTEPDRDAQAVAANEWLGRLGERLAEWFALDAAPAPEPEPEPTPPTATHASPARIALQRDDLPRRETERVDRADLGLPLSIGLISVAAVRLSKPGRRWWRKRVGASQPAHPHSHAGPHRRF